MSEISDLRQEGVRINLGGKERNIYYDLNDLCDFQKKFGSLQKALEAGAQPMGVRYFLWVGLKRENEKLTEEKAAELVTSPRYIEIRNVIEEALVGSMPKQKNEDAKETNK
ncbi:hypothetical protein [Clostridium felsineum]|uniref:Uncharacterized protein n=1 Tax=Clostridium felsineum TaxID=36839 RepID=A0A1S8L027_9CLOT|nr:hypothetical protein [Clostridium felsineum]URZ06490.1 hypothetical protein CLROS_018230 [Clostridium felsineum]URZ11525.1 hypothetical protein CROST_022420 [Clostridium felsineum]